MKDRTNNLQAYTVIRSKRRTLCLCITPEGQVIVRAPAKAHRQTIESFVAAHGDWIAKAQERVKARQARFPPLDHRQTEELRRQAKAYLPLRVEYFSRLTGLKAQHITITSAKTRFGSCSAQNRISFSLYLMRYPKPFIDYVVLHELAHTVHHDHSAAFYGLIARYMPDYKTVIKRYRDGNETPV